MSNPDANSTVDIRLTLENLSPDEKKAFATCMSRGSLIGLTNGFTYAIVAGFMTYLARPLRTYTKPAAIVGGLFGYIGSRAYLPVYCLKEIKSNEWRERYGNKVSESRNIWSPQNEDHSLPPSSGFDEPAISSDTFSSETNDAFNDGYEDLSEPVKAQPSMSYTELRQRNRADYQRKYERQSEYKPESSYTWDSRSNQSAPPAREEKRSDTFEPDTSRKEKNLYGDVWG